MVSLFTMMRLLAWFANRNKESRQALEGVEACVFFDIAGDEPFHARLKDGRVSIERGRPERFDATISGERRVMSDVVKGKISQEEAFNKKLVGTSGSIADAMRFRHLMNVTLQGSSTLRFLQRLANIFG